MGPDDSFGWWTDRSDATHVYWAGNGSGTAVGENVSFMQETFIIIIHLRLASFTDVSASWTGANATILSRFATAMRPMGLIGGTTRDI